MSTVTITPFLWFDGNAEEAVAFYQSVFEHDAPAKTVPKPPAVPGTGRDLTVEFELNGQRFIALNGGPHFSFNEAVSFVVHCDTQGEVDYFWDRLTADGGSPGRCGWLKDRFSLSWQVVPRRLGALLGKGKAVEAMMSMAKLDLAALERAAAAG